MFENIIGQDELISGLRREITEGALPRAMLFFGPSYSGKSTTALELARVLTCEKGTAQWNCPCKACELNRRLIHPNIMLLGPRYFHEEIAACAEVFRRLDQSSTRYLFLRSVRKLTRRFDPFLWEGNDGKLKKIQAFLAEVEEGMDFFLPGTEHTDRNLVEKNLSRMVELCSLIQKEGSLDGISIDRIRKVGSWTQTTGRSRKIVILENADQMQDGAKNALLKTLEEPGPEVHFILLTTRRNGILPTIASRLRHYRFLPRDEKTSRDVLQRVFREEPGRYESIREYFLAWGTDLDTLRRMVGIFLSAVAEGPSPSTDIRECFEWIKKEGVFGLFLEELLRRFQDDEKALPDSGRGMAFLHRRELWMKAIREALFRYETLNQSAALAAEHLYRLMRESVSCAAS